MFIALAHVEVHFVAFSYWAHMSKWKLMFFTIWLCHSSPSPYAWSTAKDGWRTKTLQRLESKTVWTWAYNHRIYYQKFTHESILKTEHMTLRPKFFSWRNDHNSVQTKKREIKSIFYILLQFCADDVVMGTFSTKRALHRKGLGENNVVFSTKNTEWLEQSKENVPSGKTAG